jgi:hypothetical protein
VLRPLHGGSRIPTKQLVTPRHNLTINPLIAARIGDVQEFDARALVAAGRVFVAENAAQREAQDAVGLKSEAG